MPTETNQNQDQESTVIVGAGIIGCATAYYLSTSGNTRPESIHLVEASPELFASASGKAGGFCVADWFGPPTASLGRLSFRLHQELADQYDGYTNWGYTRSTASSFMEGSNWFQSSEKQDNWLVEGGSRSQEAGTHVVGGQEGVEQTGVPGWLRRGGGSESEVIGEVGGVAQVDPLRLSHFLLRQSTAHGVKLHHPAKPVRISQDPTGAISSLQIQHADGKSEEIPCTRLLISSGAWTPSVFSTLFPTSKLRIGIQPLAGYSLIIKSPRWTKELQKKGFHAIFTSMRSGISPELFSRIGGRIGSQKGSENEIYVAGLNDASLTLPELATDARIEKDSNAELHAISQRLLGTPGLPSDLEVLKEGLCFRPVTRRGVPILARVPEEKLGGGVKSAGGVFLAAGHGPWGISHSLGTGKVMAEMLEGRGEGRLSADVRWLGLQ